MNNTLEVEDLKDKLQLLCDDAQLVQKYKSEATEFVCEKYNWDEVVKCTMELYR